MKYSYNPPWLVKKIFNDFVWNTTNNKILLTFDDGPIAETTELVLSILNSSKIKAVFFCVGDNIKKFPELTSEIIRAGHSIGNHTFNHKILRTLSHQEKLNQIQSFNKLLFDEFGYRVKYFRPPHGRFELTTKRLLKKNNLKNVMWSLLTYDYKNNFEVVKFAVKNYLTCDSIIVLHDSIKSKNILSDSIQLIIDEAMERNFSFGEADECLK